MRERIAIHSEPIPTTLSPPLEGASQSPNGAILGTVELVECIDKNEDHTFVGPYGRGWPVRVPCANRRARVVLDDPDYKRSVFERLWPNVPK